MADGIEWLMWDLPYLGYLYKIPNWTLYRYDVRDRERTKKVTIVSLGSSTALLALTMVPKAGNSLQT